MITYPTYFLDVQGIDYIINFVHIFFEVILVSNINKKRAVMIIVTYRATVHSICCLKNPNFQGEFFISEFPKLFNRSFCALTVDTIGIYFFEVNGAFSKIIGIQTSLHLK